MDWDIPIEEHCDTAVREMDRSVGSRTCGAIVSGSLVPGLGPAGAYGSFHELTWKVMVMPVMSMMGYDIPKYRMEDTTSNSTVIGVMPMNRPLDGSIRQVMTAMSCNGAGRGVVTDGFEWVLSVQGPMGPKVGGTADLRPYYIDALDRSRFRACIPTAHGDAERFGELFGRLCNE